MNSKQKKGAKDWKVYCETTGCSANQSRGNVVQGILKHAGFRLVENPEKASIIVLNTCVIKKPTQDSILYRVKELKRKNNTLVIASCLPFVLKEKLLSIAPQASLVGPHNLDKIDEIVKKRLNGEQVIKIERNENDYLLRPRLINGITATVPISKGCVGNCSYCVDKIIFGDLTSFPSERIIKEVQRLLEKGVREIRLSGQDTGPWGKDRNKNLPSLLQKIAKIEGEFQIRLGMASPDTFLEVADQVLEIMKSDQRFYRFFHLPVQSGSNKILKRMNRHYTRRDFINLIKTIRSKFSQPTIMTDIIVGFPGESEHDFKKTQQLLQKTEPESVNISRYNDRPRVPASHLNGHKSSQVKKTRSESVASLTRRISLRKNKKKIGNKVDCLVLKWDKMHKRYLGRTQNYTQVGVKTSKEVNLGSWITVKIEEATSRTLYGERM